MPAGLNSWMLLTIAIGLEVIGTSLLKLSDGFAKWYWGVAAIGLYAACFWVFANSLRAIPVGIAYAIWAGIGIVAITLVGYLAFDERLNLLQVLSMALVVAGVVGLRLSTTA